MTNRAAFNELLMRAAIEADRMKGLSYDGARVVLLVSPEIAYEYLMGGTYEHRLQSMMAYGYEVFIFAPESNDPYDSVFPAILLENNTLPFHFRAYRGMRVAYGGNLYVFQGDFNPLNMGPASYYQAPGKVLRVSDVTQYTYSTNGTTLEFHSDWGNGEEYIPYTLKSFTQPWIVNIPVSHDPIDMGEVDTSELLQFLNTFNVNNEQLLRPG